MPRKKSWEEKVSIIEASYNRIYDRPGFAATFYRHLFFLNPKIKRHFEKVDLEHQYKAFLHGLHFIVKFLDHSEKEAPTQVARLAQTHSKQNLNIHPHEYYYWIEALVLTAKAYDRNWYDDMAFYYREVYFMPISFMISLYHKS